MAESKRLESGASWVSVTVNTSLGSCRGVYIGVAGDYDFSFDGAVTWVKFTGCAAGSVLPLNATAARHNSGGTAPDAGDIVFIY
jgi:hypothetical protein